MSELTFHIHEFVPGAEGVELQHREALLKARDYATALCSDAVSRRAYEMACDARDMAGEFVFADVPVKRLEIAVKFCRFSVMAAMLADHLDYEGTAA